MFLLSWHIQVLETKSLSLKLAQKIPGPPTKTGNAHLGHIAIEAAWSYRLRPGVH